MDIIVQMLIQYAIEIAGFIVITLIGIFGSWLLGKMAQNKNLKNVGVATEQVIDAAQKTVLELQQTLVEGWKKAQDGKLTKEQVEELKIKTLEVTIAKLAKPTISLLEAAKVDIKTLITSSAEGFILQLKKSEG